MLTLSFLSQQTVIKICEIQMVRQPLRVSQLLFWFRTSSKSSYQTTKNSNSSFETNKHLNNCLSGQYATDGGGPYRKLWQRGIH